MMNTLTRLEAAALAEGADRELLADVARQIRHMTTALNACRSDYDVAQDNMRSAAFIENRPFTPEEIVREQHINRMVDLIDYALQFPWPPPTRMMTEGHGE